ncbi:NAD(P)H-hydrate dehydratase [Sinimarinibacterium sp. CAU 1509]|uniref:NAD(P)H-hydrate dehydratase n=1 Tax=Sinimarinibacterium sp. CAU 1509 TaxID=2562283 RepID=UPI0010ABBA9C|nr:NAD(P)H-hydrate dehydratase [Sinimarinibacterium sp. CAU 1509]TJY60931.1 NAD(P)H-hydrate dehydratase [Sinimarinibacterium sp. CAU 1509]
MPQFDSRLYVAAQVRELDRRAIEGHGIEGYLLMQRAAAACWSVLRERFGRPRRITIVCGGGNNGGDGYEIARLARAAGCELRVLQVGDMPLRGDAQRAAAAWTDDGGLTETFVQDVPASDCVVDAVFGTGLSRAPTDLAERAIMAIKAARRAGARVLAVDVPSGLDASTGAIPGICVDADVTVSFIGNKLGLWTGRGPAVAGERCFDDLGVPADVHDGLVPIAQLQQATEVLSLGRRARDAHKGASGHVLIIGGNCGMAGAALLAGRAALRAGAGLVSLATRPEHAAALTAMQPELMVHGVAEPSALDPLLQRTSVVALGPGLGQDEWARALYAHVVADARALVVDADALNLLARLPRRRDDWVLTPHPGEAARLLQCSVADVQRDRVASVKALQQRYGGAVLLKGAGSLVSGECPVVCPYGNPGMAVAGMGDTLTGIVAALRAQGLDAAAAARLGMLVHARAGDMAAADGERGLLPTDLLPAIRMLVNP